MRWIVANIRALMIMAGCLTMMSALGIVAPETMTRSTFGESLGGPVADVVVRSWSVLIVLVGAMLIYASAKPEMRPLALVVAATSKAAFVLLLLTHGNRFLEFGAGMALALDALWVLVFTAYLAAWRPARHQA